MPGYAEVFQRIEKKYRVDAAQRALLEAGLGAALAPDAYGRSRVTSLYLDTPDRALIDRSLEKPTYKEKLRLRAYGPEAGAALAAAFAPGAAPPSPAAFAPGSAPAASRPAAAPAVPLPCPTAPSRGASGAAFSSPDLAAASSAPVFLEIKKKLRGVVYKRRVALSLGAAVAYLGGAPYGDACAAHPLADPALQARSLSARSRQIARELDAALARHGRLVPSMAIACERVAWAPADPDAPAAAGLRVTFDDRLAFLDLMAPAPAWRPVIPPADAVMEVKSVGPYPRWLADLLAQARAYPASFSKYGTAYRLVTPPLKGGRCA